MKKIVLALILASFLALPVVGLAQVAGQPEPGEAPRWGDVDPMEVLENVTNWLFVILLIAAAIAIIVAGIYFVTAAGDADKVASARNFVLYALIGVLVGFLAKGLVLLIDKIVRG